MTTSRTTLQLENIFGKLDVKVEENLKYFRYDDDQHSLVCKKCGKIVQLTESGDTTTLNFHKHIDSYRHKNCTVTNTYLWTSLNKTFENQIPVLVRNNFHILGMNDQDYSCEICDKTIEVSRYLSTTEMNFAQHLVTDSHLDNLDSYDDSVSRLEGIYGRIPDFISCNAQYLSLARNKKYYICTICDFKIKVCEGNLDETEQRFQRHMESEPHLSNHQHERAFSRVPQLRQIYSSTELPLYILRNVEYLSTAVQDNFHGLYCSLCDVSFELSSSNLAECQESLKHHIYFTMHEKFVKEKNESNDVYELLSNNFNDIPELDVVEKFKWLSTFEDKLYCKICNVYMYEGSNENDLKEGIISHFNSSRHESNYSESMQRQQALLDELKEVFGYVPSSIQDDLSNLEFKGGNLFECTLCRKKLKTVFSVGYEETIYKTEHNFTSHLASVSHSDTLEGFDNVCDDVENTLSLLECSPTYPWYLYTNMDCLGFTDNDPTNHFFCFLCDEEIFIDSGPKRGELTLMNLKNHFISDHHCSNQKNKAIKQCLTKLELERIFGSVSNVIKNNLEHLEKINDKFRCKLCGVQIGVGLHAGSTRKNFHSHLLGETHQYILNTLQTRDEEAQMRLEEMFGEIPEYILKNLDFLETSSCGIYCSACHVSLPIDGEYSLRDNHELRYHFESKYHEKNVGSQ